MPKFQDLTGKKFGHWTVIKRVNDRYDKRGYPIVMWECECDCDKHTVKTIYGNALRSGKSTSCGCDKDRIRENARQLFSTHNESKTRLYKIWAYMKKRCYNTSALNYKDYGGRGITVCDEWLKYEAFRDWALSHGYDDTLSIDRIDVNGNYKPDNCRWVDCVAQANNKRNSVRYEYNGEMHTSPEWARILGVDYKKLDYRLTEKRMSVENAILDMMA